MEKNTKNRATVIIKRADPRLISKKFTRRYNYVFYERYNVNYYFIFYELKRASRLYLVYSCYKFDFLCFLTRYRHLLIQIRFSSFFFTLTLGDSRKFVIIVIYYFFYPRARHNRNDVFEF